MATNGQVGIPSAAVIEEVQRQSVDVRSKSVSGENKPQVHQRVWGLDARTDDTVTFEEYQYWAKIERALEAEENKEFVAERGPRSFTTLITNRFSSGKRKEAPQPARPLTEDEKKNLQVTAEASAIRPEDMMRVTDEEWRTAARALRTAGWSTIFYLITTDILGWSGAPFVFASVGFGTGVALYVVFGLAAGFAGFAIWRTFIGLDSSRFPMLSFGDPFLRIYGKRARHVINIAQSSRCSCPSPWSCWATRSTSRRCRRGISATSSPSSSLQVTSPRTASWQMIANTLADACGYPQHLYPLPSEARLDLQPFGLAECRLVHHHHVRLAQQSDRLLRSLQLDVAQKGMCGIDAHVDQALT